MKAIRETGNALLAAVDRFDSVGVMDSYFPEAQFFTEFERFDRHVEKLKREGRGIDFVSVCSPNYLHDAHIRFGLRVGADVICEKPIVLNPWNIDALQEIESETGRKVNTILQLRLHPSVIALRDRIRGQAVDKKWEVDLSYITSRGSWYFSSWKGEMSKSGGIATNIGVHFFDMLGWIFGKVQENVVHVHTPQTAAGYLEFEHARVRWFLSIDYNTIPTEVREKGMRTFRAIQIGGDQFEFSEGFTDLHTASYQGLLAGAGFALSETRPSIEVVYAIRNAAPIGRIGDYHPALDGLDL